MMKMDALALTDHGVLSGAVEFSEKAKAWGVHPILGCGFFLGLGQETASAQALPAHLTLLAMDEKGYRNLCALSSAVCREGIPPRPQVDFELLSKHADGLIAFSRHFSAAERLLDLFGRDRFRLELPARWPSDPASPAREVVSQARRLDIPLLATDEVRCLEAESAEDLASRSSGGTSLPSSFRSPIDLAEAFREFPEAVRETVETAEKCRFALDLQTRHIPYFRIRRRNEDEMVANIKKAFGDDALILRTGRIPYFGREEDGPGGNGFLRRLCEKGARKRYGVPVPLPVRERLESEIAPIANFGVADLFLLHWDLARFARQNGILLGPGRGSTPSSLVNYCLGITEIDPLRYGLVFERFMPSSGVPEFMIDCARSGRDRLIRYLREWWAPGKVVRAASFRRLSSKAAVRAVAATQKPYWDGAESMLTTIRPGWPNWSGQGLEGTPLSHVDDSQRIRLLRRARALEGIAVSASSDTARLALVEPHLAGAVPTWGEDSDPVAQLEEGDLSRMGLPVLWLTGLEGLDRLGTVLRLVEAAEGARIDLERIPLDEPAVYDMLGRGKTWGIFDWDKDSTRDLLVRLRPQRFSDLVALAALDRPGLRDIGIVDDYQAHTMKKMWELHLPALPAVPRILAESRGLLLYQEQLIHIAGEVAGMSRTEGDKLRKELVIPGRHPSLRSEFVSRVEQRGVPKQEAHGVLEIFERYAQYTFNKAHAVGWALLSYRMAWLKMRYPEEFKEAVMRHEGELWE